MGWIKRGPTGVIGTNKKDSQDTVDTLLADLANAGPDGLADFPDDHADRLADWLASRQPKLVTTAHWELIDAHERAAGEARGRPASSCPVWPSCCGSATAERPSSPPRGRTALLIRGDSP